MAKDKSKKNIYKDKLLRSLIDKEVVSDKKIEEHWKRIQKEIEGQKRKQ